MILPYLAIALLILATVYAAVVSFRARPDASTSSRLFPSGTKRSAQIAVGIATIVPLVAVTVWIGVAARSSNRPSSQFLIPEGYSGWVRVEFEVESTAPLPVEAGKNVLKIPPNGRLQTSSPEQYGWAKDSYYFYSDSALRAIPDSGPGNLIWGKINGESSGRWGRRKYEEFFVGSAEQFKEQASGIPSAHP